MDDRIDRIRLKRLRGFLCETSLIQSLPSAIGLPYDMVSTVIDLVWPEITPSELRIMIDRALTRIDEREKSAAAKRGS